jgi:hypothetical protein
MLTKNIIYFPLFYWSVYIWNKTFFVNVAIFITYHWHMPRTLYVYIHVQYRLLNTYYISWRIFLSEKEIYLRPSNGEYIIIPIGRIYFQIIDSWVCSRQYSQYYFHGEIPNQLFSTSFSLKGYCSWSYLSMHTCIFEIVNLYPRKPIFAWSLMEGVSGRFVEFHTSFTIMFFIMQNLHSQQQQLLVTYKLMVDTCLK